VLITYIDSLKYDLNREKEHELSEAEKEANTANKDLQQVETAISSLQEQLNKKKKELKGSNESYRIPKISFYLRK
jgi:peptidoglycan hydrolase CwlO-like protein